MLFRSELALLQDRARGRGGRYPDVADPDLSVEWGGCVGLSVDAYPRGSGGGTVSGAILTLELPGGEIGKSCLRETRIKLTKRCGKGGHLRKAVIEKDRELLRLDG